LFLRLQADNSATGRPDQVLAALGLGTDLGVERTRLILAGFHTDQPDATDPPDAGLPARQLDSESAEVQKR
jgi:hypothetical protein